MFSLASKLLTPTGGISCPDCMGQWVGNGLSPYLIKLFLKKIKTYFSVAFVFVPLCLDQLKKWKMTVWTWLSSGKLVSTSMIVSNRVYPKIICLVGGLEHFLFSRSYMGWHPSHWRTHSFQRGRAQPPTSCGSHCLNMWFINLCMLVWVNVSFPPAWDDRRFLAHIF